MELVVAHECPQVHLRCGTGELLDFGLVLFVFLQLFIKAALTFHNIEAVVAVVELCLAVQYFNGALGNAVQEVTVMGDGQYGAVEFQQIVFQPFRCIQVHVVGRFVQQQNVGILQNQTGKVYAGLFAARQAVE